jgi:thioredoxin reductase (NADPH)
VRLEAAGAYRCLHLDDGQALDAHAVVLATGVEWRRLDAPGCVDLVGAGIYYGAAAAEAEAVRGRDVYMVGAGNSAGQAAMHLSRYARSVTLLAVEERFSDRMSEYLLRRIDETPNVHQRPCCTVDAAEGSGRLERITIRNVTTGETETAETEALFVFIGAAPRTEWLEGTIPRDEGGYLLTGRALPRGDVEAVAGWTEARWPFLLETSLPGVFAAGDVRAGSVKRVASAVGEGAMAVQFVHQFLAGE